MEGIQFIYSLIIAQIIVNIFLYFMIQLLIYYQKISVKLPFYLCLN